MMKGLTKQLIILAGSALLLAGCAKDDLTVNSADGEQTTVTFTASIPAVMSTKAAADGDGAAANVNRCIMEIYYDGSLFARQYSSVGTDKKASFTATVVSNREYTVAFWADHVADATSATGLAKDSFYTTDATDGLKAVALRGTYLSSDDKRDAFCYCGKYTIAQGGTTCTATLKRPFAQINVITTDVATVKEVSSLVPDSVNLTIKSVVSKYNVLDSTAVSSNTSDLTYTAKVYKWDSSKLECTLSMDYIFAEKTKSVIDIDWKAKKTGNTDVSHSFTNIPYQRNYRTNIKGALLTTTGQWNVSVDPEWGGESSFDEYVAKIGAEKYFTLEDAVADANAAQSAATVTLLADVTVSSTLNINKCLTLDMDEHELTNSVPNSGYAFNVSESASFTVKDGTLAAGAVNTDLSIIKSTTAIYETISIFRDSVNAGNSYSGYTVTVLKNLTLSDWSPIGSCADNKVFSGTFDGDGKTITLTKSNISDEKYGLFAYLKGTSENPVIVNDLTLAVTLSTDGTTITRIGGLAALAEYAQFTGITVTGSIAAGHQAGGLIGWAASDASFTNCTNKASVSVTLPASTDYDFSIFGGIIAQASETITFTSCRNEGILTANHTSNPTAGSYIGHIVGKGQYPGGDNITMTSCTFDASATITGWNVLDVDMDTYPFEGVISGQNRSTYFEQSNPNKLLIGGYFANCTIDGVQSTWQYPNGVAHIQMTSAAYLTEMTAAEAEFGNAVSARGFYYTTGEGTARVFYKSLYDKGKYDSKANYSEQFKKDEYICYVPLTEMATVIGTFGDGFNSSLTWAGGTPTAANWAAYKTALESYTFTTDASSDACWSTSESKFVHIYGTKINDSLGKITIKTLPLGGGLGSATNHNIDW